MNGSPGRRSVRSTVGTRAVLALLVVVASWSPTLAQLSPGPLSRAHEELDGPAHCLDCHGRGKGTLGDRCLACHAEIDWLASRGRGLHARSDLSDCSTCHTEHGGRDHILVRFDEGSAQDFDHARAGWPLDGGHASVRCRECHNARHRVSGAATLAKRKDPERGFVGLETICSTCHEDVHRGSLGSDCAGCHAPSAWSSVRDFDHARTGYRLTGRHENVSCDRCHPRVATGTSRGSTQVVRRVLRPIAHAECVSCHRDVHDGRAGGDCSRCHTTAGFRSVAGVRFDHATTGFALTGKHAAVACEGCHRGAGAGAGRAPRPAHGRCADCHEDAHGGQLASLAAGGDCASCHRVEGWNEVAFSVADHAATGFALDGRHAAVECAACHAPARSALASAFDPLRLGRARVALALGATRCIDCHTDPHAGRFAPGGARPRERGCLACHDTNRFRPSRVTADRHREFAFPARGGHAVVACERCHAELTLRRLDLAVALPFVAETTCAGCHGKNSPHGAQFAGRRSGDACEGCHDETAFRPASRFDHRRDTRFPLLRSHRDVACARCHRPEVDAAGVAVVRYRPTTFDCKGCHSETAPTVPQRAVRVTGS